MIRTGIGYDVHRFATGRPLVLGGVEIPSPLGLEGHSDADVLAHAVADACLGAMGLPDIGHFFPPSDPAIKGISSMEILRRVRSEAGRLGAVLHHVDSTLIAEAPRVAPFLAPMKAAMAAALGLDPRQVGIKATTNEGLGFLGRGEGIAALAVATLDLP
ncbi:MAG TPA: 2-C-methyl-D-erythritol 2,4-cyclodiphosphate synthase [Verrucomicrobiales bacterium]|nr:2-C-methyl-D-erythritol 2,4-cyclodiphosphate synthase [Verrucomicrobiales bacterium]